MNEIVQTLNAHYKAEIKLVRYYWATIGGVSGSVAVNFAVADGTVDVSEPYYKLGGFHDNTPRIESLAFSCVTAGTESIFYTRADSNITDTNSLFAAIKTGPLKAVGFIGEGNYNTVSHLLPDEVSPQYQTISDMEANVLNDALIAGHNAENMPPNPVSAPSYHQIRLGPQPTFPPPTHPTPPPPKTPNMVDRAYASPGAETILCFRSAVSPWHMASLANSTLRASSEPRRERRRRRSPLRRLPIAHHALHTMPPCMPPQHRSPIRRSEIKCRQSHPAETLHAQLARPP